LANKRLDTSPVIPPAYKRHKRTRNTSTSSDTAAIVLFWVFTFVELL